MNEIILRYDGIIQDGSEVKRRFKQPVIRVSGTSDPGPWSAEWYPALATSDQAQGTVVDLKDHCSLNEKHRVTSISRAKIFSKQDS